MIKFIILAALIRLFVATENVLLCSGFYGVVCLILGFARSSDYTVGLMVGGIGFAASTVYFWLLGRIETLSSLWWLVMFLFGLALVFI